MGSKKKKSKFNQIINRIKVRQLLVDRVTNNDSEKLVKRYYNQNREERTPDLYGFLQDILVHPNMNNLTFEESCALDSSLHNNFLEVVYHSMERFTSEDHIDLYIIDKLIQTITSSIKKYSFSSNNDRH
ncbi:hypothetical protein DFA_04313 [Cavenderia fasciculata]|uniref:Uncharacterized protein n=1 Tax=Cavenderia fasciculata TaxID=261658 RepID=F4PP82_CACFS|nr:uncharacterized protein DFA_04313 [Cavenderia fasciculata]EGG22195.1 hypothetical protein DFA_04313 [Cavenderia fasciculata]|eukprot:XP_004360046.1 hypothetical protein DFA_04313 [Cavenderia fasciculata]